VSKTSVGPKVFLGLAIMYIAWGTTYIAIAVVDKSLPPLLSQVVRFLVASAALAIFLGYKRGWSTLRITAKQFRASMIIGSMLLGVGLGSMALATQHLPVGIAATLVAALPLWIAIFRAMSGDRPALLTWVGVFVGFTGVAILLMPGRTEALSESDSHGVFFWACVVLIGNLSWAIGSFISPRMGLPEDSLTTSMYEMLGGALFLIPLGYLRGESFTQMPSGALDSWLGLLYLITIGSLLGYTVFGWLLNNAPISLVSTYSYVNPVVAAVLSIPVLGQQITATMALGGAVVLFGVVLVITIEGARNRVAQAE
jgi:drug/metabolite transporter (DMT)-like permease